MHQPGHPAYWTSLIQDWLSKQQPVPTTIDMHAAATRFYDDAIARAHADVVMAKRVAAELELEAVRKRNEVALAKAQLQITQCKSQMLSDMVRRMEKP
jgi:hypothetical protein